MIKPRTKKSDPAKRRTRHDPPTIEEAVFAAQGLTSNTDEQVQIASALMGVPESEVRQVVVRAKTPAVTSLSRGSVHRPVLVERRQPRALVSREMRSGGQ